MNLATFPDAVQITMEAACDISLECWRLSRAASSAKEADHGAVLRYSVGRIEDVLKGVGLETVDLTGRKYDAGLAPEVSHVILDDSLPDGHIMIEETFSPIIMWHGRILRSGQIVVKRSPLRDEEVRD
jgi:hypothetical protein